MNMSNNELSIASAAHSGRKPFASGWMSPGLYARFGKRLLDIVSAILLFIVSAPLMLMIAIVLSLTVGIPFYSHQRVGKGGKTFGCLKFRTMEKDAARLLRLTLRTNVRAESEWAVQHKLTDDPRITKFGRLLRQTAIDELPQLLNVLKGDMSFVGPRPITEDEIKHYKGDFAIYSSLRPGLTGLWQVYGRGQSSYPKRVAFDCDYARRMGLWLDLWLILRTALVVMQRKGT